jgi:hypothetical protein
MAAPISTTPSPAGITSMLTNGNKLAMQATDARILPPGVIESLNGKTALLTPEGTIELEGRRGRYESS